MSIYILLYFIGMLLAFYTIDYCNSMVLDDEKFTVPTTILFLLLSWGTVAIFVGGMLHGYSCILRGRETNHKLK